MGRPKLLLPWGTTTVLGHLIKLWSLPSVNQLAIVHAPTDRGIETEFNRLGFPVQNRVANPDPSRGMFSSIQCAARWHGWNENLTHCTIILGDQPHLRPATLAALADLAAQHPDKICQPSHRGQPRHPVLLPWKVFADLKSSSAATLKDFLQSQSANVKLLELGDPGLDLDLDTMADYEKALQVAATE